MSFREMSAGLMALALLGAGVFYLYTVMGMYSELGMAPPPLMPLVIVYVIVLIIISIVGHIILGVLYPKEANAAMDERDRLVIARAGHWSGYILGAAVVMSLGHYLIYMDGNIMFHGAFIGLMVAQTAEYLLQMFFYRRSV